MRERRRQRPDFRERSVFDGLARRQVGQTDLVAHSLAVLTPSLSALGTGLALPALVGPGFWVSTLLGFGLAWLLALVFDQFASRFTAAGSVYTYVAKGLGPAVALVVGVAMVLAYGVLAGFGLTGGVRRLEAAWVANGGDQPGAPVGWVLLTLLVVGCVAAIHRGVHWSTRAVLVAETASVVLLCAILALWLVRHGAPGPGVLSLSGASSERVLAGAALIATLTVAFESCATVGLETDQPLRAVPASMRTSLLVTGCLFLAANLVGTVQPDREAGYTWRWFAVGQEVSRADAAALLVLAVSMAALAVCAWTALSRLLFSFAREGVLPAGVGRTNGHGVPVVATWCALPVVVVGPLVAWLTGRGTPSVPGDLLQTTTLLMGVAYGCAALALVPFLRSLDELRPATTVLAVAAVVGVAGVIWRWASGDAQLVLPLLGGVVTVGLVWSAVLGAAAPRRLRRVGAHEEALVADVLVSTAPEDHRGDR